MYHSFPPVISSLVLLQRQNSSAIESVTYTGPLLRDSSRQETSVSSLCCSDNMYTCTLYIAFKEYALKVYTCNHSLPEGNRVVRLHKTECCWYNLIDNESMCVYIMGLLYVYTCLLHTRYSTCIIFIYAR